MAIALFVLGLVFAALAVWGTVRYINCKTKPSLRLLAGVALLTAALYLLSIGPASWLAIKMGSPTWYTSGMGRVYAPIHWVAINGPTWLKDGISWYCPRWINAA